jgi:hypothetical protein
MKIKILTSAYKHGYGDDDITNALENIIFSQRLNTGEDFFVGGTNGGVLIEIIGEIRNNELIVFHCMKLRKKFHHLLQ